MTDLFQHPELLCDKARAVFDEFAHMDNDYASCKELEAALKPLGYTFEWGLDAEPFNLTKTITP
jgi:hypothetical protein